MMREAMRTIRLLRRRGFRRSAVHQAAQERDRGVADRSGTARTAADADTERDVERRATLAILHVERRAMPGEIGDEAVPGLDGKMERHLSTIVDGIHVRAVLDEELD